MNLIRILVIFALSSSFLFSEEKPEQWSNTIPQLFGSWESDSIIPKGLDVERKFKITFHEDGSFVYEDFMRGDSVWKQKGIYAVGKAHIYLWSGGPPSDDVDQDPHDYYRALLMSYKFDADQIKVEFLDGSRQKLVFTLKQIKAEQAAPSNH